MAKEPVTVIGISGLVATGKGTISDLLSKRLRWLRHSGGDSLRAIQRATGNEHLRPDEFAKQTPGLDDQIERMNRAFVTSNYHRGCVIEARLVLQAIKGCDAAYSVILVCDDEVRFEREIKRAEQRGVTLSLSQARVSVLRRDEQDRNRYRELYGIENFTNPDLYDLVIDTGKWSELEVTDMIMHNVRKTW